MRLFGGLFGRRLLFGGALALWIAGLGGLVAPVAAQSGQQRSAQVTTSEAGYHDVSPPLRDIPPAPRNLNHEVRPWRKLPVDPSKRGNVATPGSGQVSAAAPNLLASFERIGQGFSGPHGTFSVGAAPPDPNGTVGPNHYVEIVNTDFAVFNKSGTPLYGPVPINTLWSGFGGLCQTNNDGDPDVSYDQIADRWLISQFALGTATFNECVAVSQTPDPTD